MKEELFKELQEQYKFAKGMIFAKWLSDEMEGKEEDKYDVALFTIYYKDLAEDVPIELPLVQVRIRKDEDKDYEEIVLVMGMVGANKEMEDEKDLEFCAEKIEWFTERFLEDFPDAIYRYERYTDKKDNDNDKSSL